MQDPSNAIVHFYRASVMHADVWRRRLDATTNWAVVSTAAIVTFAFSSPDTPHFVLLLAVPFGSVFLLMESRRYQTFDVWRRRVQLLNRWVIVPALVPANAPPDDEVEAGLAEIASSLGTSVPPLSLLNAMGYRLRRNYGLLFLAVLAAWLLKIGYQPTVVASGGEFVDRAGIGLVPGVGVLSIAGLFVLGATFVALRARTERMAGWTELPSPLDQALGR